MKIKSVRTLTQSESRSFSAPRYDIHLHWEITKKGGVQDKDIVGTLGLIANMSGGRSIDLTVNLEEAMILREMLGDYVADATQEDE